MPKRRRFYLATLASLTLLLAACGHGDATIPPAAQTVHVKIIDSGVWLDPGAVHAGDIYLALDEPVDGSLTFVGLAGENGALKPLTDEAMVRLDRGDLQGTSISGLDAGGCDAQQNAEARGRLGHCGNVMLVTLQAGRYAIIGGAPENSTSPLGFLEVLP